MPVRPTIVFVVVNSQVCYLYCMTDMHESRTMTLREALMTLACEHDQRGVLACATIARDAGTERERATACSALAIVGGQAAHVLRAEIAAQLGWPVDGAFELPHEEIQPAMQVAV